MEENEDKKHETHPMEATDLFLKSYLTSKLASLLYRCLWLTCDISTVPTAKVLNPTRMAL